MKTKTLSLLFILLLSYFSLSPTAQAVVPPPDGGYPNFNTAEGQNALFSLTTGQWNTALGGFTLWRNTDGNWNTAVGTAALLLNNNGDFNTATGVAALINNTTGSLNTATGLRALFSNTNGNQNTADGDQTLVHNTTGDSNVAVGDIALFNNTSGDGNTAVGAEALDRNSTGNYNTALGFAAGSLLTTGDNNIDVGYNVFGLAGEANTIRIGNTAITDTYITGISGATASGGAAVFADALGKLDTMTSSARFKRDIQPMGSASEAILALRPVTFRYKKELDPKGVPQFGLVAEDVDRMNPDLVIRDAQGAPQTVRYEQINAMLLNEFLKEHRKVQELEANVVRQQKQIETLTAGLQKVSAQLEVSRPAPQTVKNNQ